eukprot:COSAG02_NODE_7574_length_2955_cov_12.315476_4_plen_78_part_00
MQAATFFLNIGWDTTTSGGMSRLCAADRPNKVASPAVTTTDVSPTAGHLLLWLPHKCAHSIMPVQRNLWSLTTYFNV